METPTKTTDKDPAPKKNFFSSPAHLLLLVIVFVGLLFCGIYISHHRQTQAPAYQNTSTGPTLSLTTDQSKPQTNSIISVDVWEDSGDQGVNATQANINFSSDSLEFLSIDSQNSAFEIQAQSTGQNGTIIIARGHKGSLTGRQRVATVKLKVSNKTGATNLTFTKDSALISSTTNKNILKQANPLNLTIGVE